MGEVGTSDAGALAPMDDAARLQRFADAIRQSGILGKAALMRRLFDFLVERSAAGIATKEVELAQAVFRQGPDVDLLQDASVRVYIHRLRRKLDEFYAGTPHDERLTIPKGEYRLAIVKAAEPSHALADAASGWRGIVARRSALVLAGLALFGLGAASVRYWGGIDPRPPAARTSLWAFLNSNGRPTFIVIGDYYAFGLRDGAGQRRLTLDPAINSRNDLDQLAMAKAPESGKYTDLDAHYLSAGAAFALRSILPIIDSGGTSAGRARILLVSDLTPEVMKGANIIYIGTLDRLGKLNELAFRRSRFRVEGMHDLMVDAPSGKAFTLGLSLTPRDDAITREYAYISTFEGPSGSRFVIIAGSRDASVKQAAESSVDVAQISRMTQAAKGNADFEALWKVDTLRNVSYNATLIGAFPLARPR